MAPAMPRAEVGVDSNSTRLRSVGLLAVKVSDAFKTAGEDVHGCRAVDIAGTKRMTCKTAWNDNASAATTGARVRHAEEKR